MSPSTCAPRGASLAAGEGESSRRTGSTLGGRAPCCRLVGPGWAGHACASGWVVVLASRAAACGALIRVVSTVVIAITHVISIDTIPIVTLPLSSFTRARYSAQYQVDRVQYTSCSQVISLL